MGLRDGLEGDKVLASGLGAFAINPFFAGNVVASGDVSGANVYGTTTMQGINFIAAGSADIPLRWDDTGSPYKVGDVTTAFTAETIITGGQWVTVSGAAGGASMKARAAAASTNAPLGVALATVASGATVSILTRGFHYFVADGTIANGEKVIMGAGAALNCVTLAGAGSAYVGKALAGAASGGTALIYIS